MCKRHIAVEFDVSIEFRLLCGRSGGGGAEGEIAR
ncbi:MAG: hypothetical protein J07HQX50_00225 [Haloquadratum sp. J07HQX50]|nr:MAG: hypothetical protein J07HQX50_00225 [Haloquadratum sp. J07HQX50]